MNVPFSPPDISEAEINAVIETMRSGWITTGPKTKEFEKSIAQYLKANAAVCLSSQTAAAELTLRLLGVGEGDEVIVPAYTFTATASVVLHVGAKPVMCDQGQNLFELDLDMLESLINEKTKVIMPVDLGGAPCDYNRIFDIITAKGHLFKPNGSMQEAFGRIIVVADAAHSFGASWGGKMVGTLADFSCFSFHAVKNVTTAEGGACVWKDIPGISNDEIYKQFKLMSLHGQTKDALEKSKANSWDYDIVGAYYKANMTDIQAAIGIVQLERYPEMFAKRHSIVSYYDSAIEKFGSLHLIHKTNAYISSAHLYMTYTPGIDQNQRNQAIIMISTYGVSCNVHYKPLPMLTAYKKLGYKIEDYPNAYKLFEGEITLPLYSSLSEDAMSQVVGAYEKAIGRI